MKEPVIIEGEYRVVRPRPLWRRLYIEWSPQFIAYMIVIAILAASAAFRH